MRRAIFPLAAITLIAMNLPSPQDVQAQQTTHTQPRRAKVATGALAGHVYCGDTNAPARMATVAVLPAAAIEQSGSKDKAPDEESSAMVQTELDGSFSLPKIPAGTYYLMVHKEGYISPLAQLSELSRESITPEQLKDILSKVPKAVIQADQSANVDVQIERGAAINGTVSFDDASPAAGLHLSVIEKSSDGTWKKIDSSVLNFSGGDRSITDDQGHYRIAGLPPGQYMVELSLQPSMLELHNLAENVSGPVAVSTFSFDSLSIYSGGAMRQKDAATFKLTAGEERTGEDFVIPLTKIHAVSGTVIASSDGHSVNNGEVSLLNADDHTQVASTQVQGDSFRFPIVPEGDYILDVKDARDVVTEALNTPAEGQSTEATNEKVLHAYGEGQQPVQVRGDMSGLVVSVPKANQGATAASAAVQQ